MGGIHILLGGKKKGKTYLLIEVGGIFSCAPFLIHWLTLGWINIAFLSPNIIIKSVALEYENSVRKKGEFFIS